MNQEVYFRQKFRNMKSNWVHVGESFLAPSNESNEVEHLLVEPRNDLILGNCLNVEDYSCDFDYGIQTDSGGLDDNSKQGGERELNFDFDQLLGDANGVEEFHATDSLHRTYIEVGENASRTNREPDLENLSSGSKFQTSSMSKDDIFGTESSATIVLESECNDKPVDMGFTCESSSALRTNDRCVTAVEGSICSASLDRIRNIQGFDTNESDFQNGVLSDENVKGYIERSKLASSSRERRSRKPTRRYIEEFADSKSEAYKGRRKPPIKEKYMKVVCSEKNSHIKHKAQTSMPREESFCRTSIPVQSRTHRGCPKKHLHISEFLSEDESSTARSQNVELSTKRCKSHDRRKHQRTWTLSEVMRLVDGIAEYGTGRWTHIKRNLFASSAHRTPIDLRDKWRNLLKASCVYVPNKRGIEQKKLHASRPLPKSLLQRVQELANIHPYPKERSTKSIQKVTPSTLLAESISLSFNWGRKK